MSYSERFRCIFGQKFSSSLGNSILLVNRMVNRMLMTILKHVFVNTKYANKKYAIKTLFSATEL